MGIHAAVLATVRADDLSDDMQLLADEVGLEAALRIMDAFAGVVLYVPKGGLKKTVERFIADNYDGTNARRLALMTGMTERYVYSTLEKNRAPDPRQGGLFESEENPDEETEPDNQGGEK